MTRLLIFLPLIATAAFAQWGSANKITSGYGAPSVNRCSTQSQVGNVYARRDGAGAFTTLYVCGATGASTYGWELYNNSGGGGGSSTGAQLAANDYTPTRTSATVLTLPAINANTYSVGGSYVCSAVSSGATVTVSSGTGTIWLALGSDCTVKARHNVVASCSSGCTAVSSSSGFDATDIPLYEWVVTSGSLAATGTLRLTAYGGTALVAGAGISLVSVNGVTTINSSGSLIDPTTTNGDLIYRTGGVLARLGVGTNGQIFKVSSGLPSWGNNDGTVSTSFQIDSGASGPLVKNSSGVLQVRNAADSAFANLRVATITADSYSTSGSGGGSIELSQGTAPTLGTNAVTIYPDTSVTSWGLKLPGISSTGFYLGTNSSNINTLSFVPFTGTGDVVRGTSPTIATPTFSGAITFPSNTRQTFSPGASSSGLNVGSFAGDPSTPSNGDLWYDSTANELTARINGSNVALGSGGGGSNRQITLVVNDVSSTGAKSCSVVEVAGTIIAAHLIANALPTGANLAVDVRKVGFTSYTGTAAATSITASAIPTIATTDSNPRYEDTTLTGWTTSVSANDVICVQITTAPTGGATWAALSLEVQ